MAGASWKRFRRSAFSTYRRHCRARSQYPARAVLHVVYGAPLGRALVAELAGGGTVRLLPQVRVAIDELGLVAPDALEAARSILEGGIPDFAETLRTVLVEDLAHSVDRWTTRKIVNPFESTGASLGVAFDALNATVQEARRTAHDRLEVTSDPRCRRCSSGRGLPWLTSSAGAGSEHAAVSRKVIGSVSGNGVSTHTRPQNAESPASAGLSPKRLKGLEPSTFCMASRRSSQLSYSRTGRPV
jgi:hypothetical protein